MRHVYEFHVILDPKQNEHLNSIYGNVNIKIKTFFSSQSAFGPSQMFGLTIIRVSQKVRLDSINMKLNKL